VGDRHAVHRSRSRVSGQRRSASLGRENRQISRRRADMRVIETALDDRGPLER